MIQFVRTMEMSITIIDPRYTEQDIAEGLSNGTLSIGDTDLDNNDYGKIYNSVWDEIAVINDSHVSDIDAPDHNFTVI